MTATENAWTPYGEAKPPRSRGGITLAELMQACCRANWLAGDEMIDALVRDDGTGPIGAVRDTMRMLGEAVIDGSVDTWARPIGGGAVVPLPPAMWEIDDFETRVRTSALDLDRWADDGAEPTHWIFANADDAAALVARIRAELDEDGTAPSADPLAIVATPDLPATADAASPRSASATDDPGPPQHSRARRFLKIKDVIAATKLSKTRIYEKMKLGTFPKAVKMGSRATAWYEDEVHGWIEAPR